MRSSRPSHSKFTLTGGPMLPMPRDPGRSRLFRRLGLAALVAAAVMTHAHWLRGYAMLFRVDDPAPSDAVMILLGGPSHRPARALELYKTGTAACILLGQGVGTIDGERNESVVTREYLLARGVPESAAVVLPGPVHNTRDEALRLRDYVRTHGIKRVTIVTTSFHTARALWIFRRVCAGIPVEIRAAAAEEPHFNESDWFRTGPGLSMYAVETLKRIFYQLAY